MLCCSRLKFQIRYICFLQIVFIKMNSVDAGEMSHSVASHLGLLYLQSRSYCHSVSFFKMDLFDKFHMFMKLIKIKNIIS